MAKPRSTAEPRLPRFIEPMQLQLTNRLPSGPEWIYEIKFDGYRGIAIKRGERVALLSRNHKDIGKDFPEVMASVAAVQCKDAVLDGEVVALDSEGRPSFQALQNRGKGGFRVVYYAFDLLWLNGTDLCGTPLEQRKAKLADLVAGSGLYFSAGLEGDPTEIASKAAAIGIEGIVAKRRDSVYAPGARDHRWQKLKLDQDQDFVVGGYSGIAAKMDSLVVGYYEGDQLQFCGRIRNGFNPHIRRLLTPRLRELSASTCPFTNLPQQKRDQFGAGILAEDMAGIRWLKPELVVRVGFVEWTRAGMLRHPKFRGIRDDADPVQVRRELVR